MPPIRSDRLSLCPDDLANLRGSGLADTTIRENGLRTDGDALVFPYRDLSGTVNCFTRRRPHEPGGGAKYLQPPGTQPRAYYPAGCLTALRDAAAPLYVTEGEKKALALGQLGLPAVCIGGVWSGCKKGTEELIPDLAALPLSGRTVYIVFDYDPKPQTRSDVDLARRRLARAFRTAGAGQVLSVELPPGPGGGKMGADDYLVAHGAEAFRKLVEAAQPVPDRGRAKVRVTTREDVVNELAAAALAADPGLYQRGGVLVHVVRSGEDEPAAGLYRPPGSPRIAVLPSSLLRERLSANAEFVNPDGEPLHPPAWCVQAVHARGRWPGVRPLAGVTDVPVLRPDGTVLAAPGYDPATGLLFLPGGPDVVVPGDPTPGDVAAAVALLDDLVCDFPFEKPEHKAAWVAFLLTPLARPAFDGPAPLTLFDGNVRGAGKGLVCGLVSLVVTGRDMPVSAASVDDEEMRKAVTAAAIAGDPLIVLDNVAGGLGGPTLDAVMTSTRWADRLLGTNTRVDLELRAVWAATGNNVVLRGDMARRVNVVRLCSPEENPEDRTGFRHPDLRSYARGHRAGLLAAGLTILRGYCAAGRPALPLTPWGSFEGWSGLVRAAVVWAGYPDPGLARTEVRKASDPEAAALPALLAGLARLDPSGKGLTVAEVIAKSEFGTDPEVAALREALTVLCPGRGGQGTAGPRSVGMKFHHLRGRVVGGLLLERLDDSRSGARWRVGGTTGTGGTTPGPAGPTPATPGKPKPKPSGVAAYLRSKGVTG